MFCPACGTKNEDSARFCHSCGNAVSGSPPPAPKPIETMRGLEPVTATGPTVAAGDKNPVLAVVLSCVIVGVGQFYNNDWKKGLLMLGGTLVLSVPTGGIAWLGFAIWSAIDAYMVAKGTGKRW
jgi:TM2 domain-containing membrane protein YozV